MINATMTSRRCTGFRYATALLRAVGCIASLALLAAAAQAQPSTIAHWTFDTPSLTMNGGNITAAADTTGSHNAQVLATGVGTAPVSAPFAASDSVAGQFGQAIRFSGTNYMAYPQLTELMQSSGGPSYSVSMWIKWLNAGPPVGNTVFRTMGTWGNAAAPAGPPFESSRFSYGFGPNGATTIRAQTRFENNTANGGDIFARNSTATITDGLWHMLTWTFNTTSGVLNTYFDGTSIDTFTSTAASFQMADSTSMLGTFGLKGDDNTMQSADTQLDEVWVFNGALTPDDVVTLRDNNGFGPPPVPGDTDGDGIGGEFPDDFTPIQMNFRKSVSMRSEGDLVRNGVVDFNDFRQWKAAHLGMGGSLEGLDLGLFANIPEPTTFGLALVAVCGLAASARRGRLARAIETI